MAESDDLMQLTVGTGQTASQVIERREKQRQERGCLLPPPPGVDLAKARMEDPGPDERMRKPNREMEALLQYLNDIFVAGGTQNDLMAAWQDWKSPFPQSQAKLPARDVLDDLIKRALVREAELLAKSAHETEPERSVAHVKPQLQAAEQSAAEAREEWREAQSRAARMVRDQPESWAALHARRAAESTAAELKKAVQALADLKRSLANAEHRLKERAR